MVHELEVNRNDLQATDQLDPSHATDTVRYDLKMKAKLPITPIFILDAAMSSSLDVAASNLKKLKTASGNQYLPLYDRRKCAQAKRAHRQGVVEDEYI